MFTGIVETVGTVRGKESNGDNIILDMASSIAGQLKIDQSVAHNGVCLTVIEVQNDHYKVEAVRETLEKTNLDQVKVGHRINLERSLMLGSRVDGHMVQGHVDATAMCSSIEKEDGSTIYTFQLKEPSKLIVEKGSINVNGISLTAYGVSDTGFQVAVIPYTYENTNISDLKVGEEVNIEFDIIGKYLRRFAKDGSPSE